MTQRNKIAFFGTSHTFGDCAEGISHHEKQKKFVAKPWPVWLAKKLNKQFYNFGIGGCDNMSMLDAILEAFKRGTMDEVDTLILEPRLNFDTVKLPYDNTNYEPKKADFLKRNKMNFTHWLDFGRHHREHKWSTPAPLTEYFWARFALYDLEEGERFRNKLRADYVGDPKEKPFVDKDIKSYVELGKLYESKSIYVDYVNVQFIRNVKLICDAHGIDFYWVDFEGHTKKEINQNKNKVFKDHIYNKEVMDVCLNPEESVRKYIRDRYKYEDYICSCYHFNERAQAIISEYLLQGYYERKNK